MADNYHSSYEYTEPQSRGSNAWIWVVMFIILILIIAVLIYFFYPTTPTVTGTTWNITEGTGTSDQFLATAGHAYVVPRGSTGTFNLQLIAPINARGQEFLIIHGSSSVVNVTVQGGTPYNISPNRSAILVWLSQTEFAAVS